VDAGNREKVYDTGWGCPFPKNQEILFHNLDVDPPIEAKACATTNVIGFVLKLDSGNIRVWGYLDENLVTEWEWIGGAIVGFY